MCFNEIIGIICISTVMLLLLFGGIILWINCLFEKKDKIIDKLNNEVKSLQSSNNYLENRNSELSFYVSHLETKLFKFEDKKSNRFTKK